MRSDKDLQTKVWPGGYDRVWRWRKTLPDRRGQPCRVLARGKRNSVAIEFDDGVRHVVSRFAIRKRVDGDQ